MKRIYVIVVFLAGMMSIQAQQEEESYRNDEFKTIFGGREIGGYGGIGVGYSEIDSRPAVVFDARGGIILGHSLAMGVGGAGFINEYENDPALNREVSLVGGYGGFFLEPILLPKYPVHLSFPVLVGMGGAANTSFVRNDNSDITQDNSVEETSKVFLVVEPSAELEFNLTRFMRMAAYFSYRYTSDLGFEEDIPSDALISYTVGMRIKFGKF